MMNRGKRRHGITFMIHRKGFESFAEKAACMNIPEKKKMK